MGTHQKPNGLTQVNSQALDMLHQVRRVNCVLQAVCARLGVAELSEVEGEGVYHLLEWQSEKIIQVERIVAGILEHGAQAADTN